MSKSARAAVSLIAVGAALAIYAPRARAQDADACIAASESALSLRKSGKLVEARKQLATCASASCPDPIRPTCQQRLADVNKAMPSLILTVKDAAGNDVAGVKVTMDGQVLASGSAGTAFDLNPGEHAFTFEAPGRPKVEKSLVLVEGAKQRREVIVMGAAEPASAPTTTSPAPSAAPGSSGTTPPPARETPTGSAGPPTLSIVAFGVGGAGVALGVVAGLIAAGKHSDLSNVCSDATGTCPPAYSSDLDSFHTWRLVSTAGYVLGALGIAGGVALWIVAPKPARGTTSARVWFGPASAGIAGGF